MVDSGDCQVIPRYENLSNGGGLESIETRDPLFLARQVAEGHSEHSIVVRDQRGVGEKTIAPPRAWSGTDGEKLER